MKPSTSIIALAAGGVVAQNGVPPSCGDPIDQKLTSLIDAGDGARYLSGTHTPDCAINGTDQPFSPDQPSPGGGSNLQFHNETVSPDDFYCSKVSSSVAHLTALGSPQKEKKKDWRQKKKRPENRGSIKGIE